MQIKSRHHLRDDEVRDLTETLGDALGVDVDADAVEEVAFSDTDRTVYLVDGEPLIATFDGEPFLTVRGANELDPERRLVTVDAGAVSFVSDGANVMRPGIVDADEDIVPGDLVVIVEETHGKALAVGRAEVPGGEMPGDSGMVVESIHHVGDDLFAFSI
ncbi:MAG: RNA-binding protein [Haloarculaceae archaeon]